MKLGGRAGGVLIQTLADPLVLIPLSSGGKNGDGSIRYALIDASDYHLVQHYKWQSHWNWTTRTWYARASILIAPRKRRCVRLHRLILGIVDNPILQGDHRNTSTLDNRRSNLRLATNAQNGRNRKLRADNKFGVKGVHMTANGKWRAMIRNREGRLLSLGTFTMIDQASNAYDTAARNLHGEFARANQP